MADGLHIAIPDLEQDLNAILEVADPANVGLKHFLITVQLFRNLSVVLNNIANLEQKMSDQINSITAEVSKDAAVMTAAAAVIQAALSAEATLKDQLTKATDPADQQALADAETTLAAARATLQTAVDAGNAANPPAPPADTTGASSAPADAGAPPEAPDATSAGS